MSWDEGKIALLMTLMMVVILLFLGNIITANSITELENQIKEVEENQTKVNEYILNRIGG